MDIRVLTYFIAIVQTGSISNAAQSLHITQPTLSRQIKELEQELDTILFYRGSREIQLTEAGQYLYNRALEITSLVKKTEDTLRPTEMISGDLYIGAAESQSLEPIARAIASLTSQYPNTRVHIQSGNADHILEQLQDGIQDVGITFGRYSTKKFDSLPLLNRDSWGILVPRFHPLASKEELVLSDVLAYPLIVSSQSNVDKSIFAGLSDYRIVATYNLLYNASLLVKAGVGIALCLDGIVDTSYDGSGLVFRLLDLSRDSLQLLWKKGVVLSPIAKRFIEILEEDLENANLDR
ncbi:LysR family transcriptional regulator [Streptococcus suis]|uniref:LysR family transcriptional regulator n=1 Tax=Streptococcus suis TaxID=1307 RepID=A0A9X4MSE0_STRSU|nr:LysR family transcriptional regulator [Streptococcus suis]MDG4527420.1 LysR family transcriptional regulator [Streptococcus suis]MDG4529762.1 LysR family transcriptional regulator [Streptococcus suis]NQM08271.1 LysR family transcriptional regulator [Streptococcus suis]HEM3581911.1 LysR family transcriptional regulator [Streptococcus suis]HEM4292188.1 LysR family transcriptional regulator [Streptococcus suis]